MSERLQTWSRELNDLLGGGFIRGGGSLFRYQTEAIADPVFLTVGAGVVDAMLSVVLIPRASLSSAATEAYLDLLNISLRRLLDNDQLFVIDVHGGWEDYKSRNVFSARHLTDIQDATMTALERSRARGTVHMVDIGAVVSTLGEPQARQLREWYASDALRGTRDFLLEAAHIPPLSEELAEFYVSLDEQVLRFDQEDGTVHVRVDGGREKTSSEVRTVEYLQKPPFIRIR